MIQVAGDCVIHSVIPGSARPVGRGHMEASAVGLDAQGREWVVRITSDSADPVGPRRWRVRVDRQGATGTAALAWEATVEAVTFGALNDADHSLVTLGTTGSPVAGAPVLPPTTRRRRRVVPRPEPRERPVPAGADEVDIVVELQCLVTQFDVD